MVSRLGGGRCALGPRPVARRGKISSATAPPQHQNSVHRELVAKPASSIHCLLTGRNFAASRRPRQHHRASVFGEGLSFAHPKTLTSKSSRRARPHSSILPRNTAVGSCFLLLLLHRSLSANVIAPFCHPRHGSDPRGDRVHPCVDPTIGPAAVARRRQPSRPHRSQVADGRRVSGPPPTPQLPFGPSLGHAARKGGEADDTRSARS